MTWQAAAFTILAVGLAAGFAWYERTKPDARLVALVGTLAAFAALGRIAFAPIPNVKPTTDIVIFAGYALGGAPGFAVGALAALVSNFWFGQGPWTPWQMAGWGLCGILGAALAATSAGITSATFLDLGIARSRAARTVLGAAVVDDVLALLTDAPKVDEHQLAHLAAVHTALRSGEALLADAADLVDAAPDVDHTSLMNTCRAAAERAAWETLDRVPRITGATPLCRDHAFAQRLADLQVYVLQHHAERDLAALGRAILAEAAR